MPFMRGVAPVRRTLQYLENYSLKLKDSVQVFTLHYNMSGAHHEGARNFAFWSLPQLQFKNPDVQIVTLKEMTPSPFIRLFLNGGEEVLVDIDSKTKEEINEHLKKIICKSDNTLVADDSNEIKENPAHFGWGCTRQCVCEVMGQVPCPMVVPLPRTWRGKYKNNPDLLEETEEYILENN